MAIEKVHIYNNTSIIQDEVLAHRLGLIPLKADPRLFEMRYDGNTMKLVARLCQRGIVSISANSEFNEQDSLEFELKIKCSSNKDSNKDSSRAEDIYKNSNGEFVVFS